MARIDKVAPVGGTFRAYLAAAWTGQAAPIGVGLDVNGRVVPGAGNTGIIGVICIPRDRPAGGVVDLLKDAELVEFAGVAGTNYFADGVTGAITAGTGARTDTGPVTAGSKKIGHTIEATRLFVRIPGT